MPIPPRTTGLLCWLFCLFFLAPALAQEQPQREQEGYRLYSAGKEDQRLGRLKEALGKFEQAYKVYPETPCPLLLIARICGQLSRPLDGLRALDQYVYHSRQASPEQCGENEQAITLLKAQLEGGIAHLVLHPDKPDARLLIDGKDAAPDQPVSVNPGRHRIEVPLAPWSTQTVLCRSGETLRLLVRVKEPPRKLAVAKWATLGTGLLLSAAGSVIWALDGHQTCPQAPHCHTEYDTYREGITVLSVGGATLVTSAVLFVLDFRARRRR